jgi:DNA-nicking Smr family endonuclease
MTAGDKPRRPRISDEDVALWQAVARTIKPLKRRRPTAEAGTAASKPKPQARPPKLVPVRLPAPPPPPEPPLIPLARRERQRLSRGTAGIEARLDLHGRTQDQAHTALLRFLRSAQLRGDKTVLVITGKGRTAESERGVLRRQVPLWLALPEFRELVVGFSAAAIGHGGEGALYVRVRKAR